MRWIAGLIVGLTVMEPVSAQAAGFVMNRTSWDSMSASDQESYLMGAFDYQMTYFTTDSQTETASKNGIANCVLDLKLNSGSLRRIVNDAYAADVEVYTYAPGILLYRQLIRMCRTHVNAERAKSGLKPLTSQ